MRCHTTANTSSSAHAIAQLYRLLLHIPFRDMVLHSGSRLRLYGKARRVSQVLHAGRAIACVEIPQDGLHVGLEAALQDAMSEQRH